MGYISFPIEVDPVVLRQAAYEYIKSRAPGWYENDANLDVWILQIAATFAADLRTLASDVPDTVFRYFGTNLLGLPFQQSAQAIAKSTWVMRDNAGYTIPAGTAVSIRNNVGEEFAFEVVTDVTVSAGSTATAAGGVDLIAVEPGAASSGLAGAGTVITLIDVLDFVTTVTLTTITSGGADAETDTEYLDRLTEYTRRLSRRPILPEDFSRLARDISGVARAVAIDGYNPANATFNNERMVAIAAIDAVGANVSAGIKSAIDAYLQANREVNFVVNVIDPTRTTIDVTFTGKAKSGYVASAVELAAEAAVADYLSPRKWGRDPRYVDTGSGGDTTWVETTILRYFEMSQLISNVEGMDYLQTLTMGKNPPGTLGTADITLTSPASLTVAGAILGTVT